MEALLATDPDTLLFWLKKLAAALVLPPFSPLLLVMLGLMLIGSRRPRPGLTLAWLGCVLGVLFMVPASVGLLTRPLEQPPIQPEALRSAQAIVILGGGIRRFAPEYGAATINRLTLERLRYGAHLSASTRLPVLVAGGAPREGVAEAPIMAEVLQKDFGVAVRWIEDGSRDTAENAALSAAKLRADGIERIALVTHALHMPRAAEAFRAEGLVVLPAPTGHSGDDHPLAWQDLMPSANAAFSGWFALHEWLGGLVYRLTRS